MPPSFKAVKGQLAVVNPVINFPDRHSTVNTVINHGCEADAGRAGLMPSL
jgi:hypothetical protein